MTEGKTILGIDPGTNLLGFGVIRVDEHRHMQYVDMGVLDLRKVPDAYSKLACIHNYIAELCEQYHPDDMAIESPFMGKNAQVIFKLGRAQGAAIIAATEAGCEVTEYAPRKAKIAVCGNGAASKEQVADIAQRTLGIKIDQKYLDATDALAIAMCHFYQITSPARVAGGSCSWEKFIAANPDRINKK
ncbi:MAG: crossover junction endodeoxyribonuclease RuvC [Bacteroidales bacterium]|nr:crossover junction endodeoxyribonuclease RuvC [Candidatus Cryptobacteroides aphodequi]